MPTKKTTKKTTAKKVVAKKTVKKAAAKKPAVKKVAKKTAAKKTASKQASKKELVYADDQRSFWVTNGRILNSLVALSQALDEMEKEVYTYHAGKAHNDFAQWVSDVLGDHACAVDLSKAKSPKSAKTVVVKHLKSYTV